MTDKAREWVSIPPERGRDPYDLFKCPVCGLEMAWFERNKPVHKHYHNNILDICDKYGLCLFIGPREKLKIDAYDMKVHATDIKEKKFAFLLEWYSRFMRSLIAYHNIKKHPSFEDYISMILYQDTFDGGWLEKLHGQEVISSLIDDFGTLKGIPGGSYFLDDYSMVSGAPFKNYHNGKVYVRKGIPKEFSEPAIRQWVENWCDKNNF